MTRLLLVTFAALAATGCGGSPKVLGSHAGHTLEIRHNDDAKAPCAQGSHEHPNDPPVGTIVAGFRKLELGSIERLAANVKLGFQDVRPRTAICIVRKSDGLPVAGFTARGGQLLLWKVTDIDDGEGGTRRVIRLEGSLPFGASAPAEAPAATDADAGAGAGDAAAP